MVFAIVLVPAAIAVGLMALVVAVLAATGLFIPLSMLARHVVSSRGKTYSFSFPEDGLLNRYEKIGTSVWKLAAMKVMAILSAALIVASSFLFSYIVYELYFGNNAQNYRFSDVFWNIRALISLYLPFLSGVIIGLLVWKKSGVWSDAARVFSAVRGVYTVHSK